MRAHAGPSGSAAQRDSGAVGLRDEGAGNGPLLRARAIARAYDGVNALADVSLDIERREIIGLIGPNGAGKTTLINLLTGFDLPTTGTIEFDGRDITRWKVARRARAGLARTFQHGHLFAALTLRENIELGSLGVGTRARDARAWAAELLAALDLTDRAEIVAGALSHGEQQKAGVARALASRPRFVLLDEPAAGLSEADVEAFSRLLESVRTQYGASVLIVEHNIALVMQVSDRIHVLDGGRTLAEGTAAQIRENIDVTAAYLGSGGADPPLPVRGGGDG